MHREAVKKARATARAKSPTAAMAIARNTTNHDQAPNATSDQDLNPDPRVSPATHALSANQGPDRMENPSKIRPETQAENAPNVLVLPINPETITPD